MLVYRYSTNCSCQILIKLDRRTDGQTYMTNITPALRSIANTLNIRSYLTEDTTWVHYKENRLMLLRKISVIYCTSCMKHTEIHVRPKTLCFAHISRLAPWRELQN
jgi:hypothetical protein